MKVCSKCKEEKPLEAFSKYSRSSDGYKGQCKSCASNQGKEYYERTKVLNPRVPLYGPEDIRVAECYDGMKARCYNPKNKDYKNYGGRGITICDEWLGSRQSFVLWAWANGYSDELTIDRKDPNGNYEPDNCRWATLSVQARNKRPKVTGTSKYTGVNFNKVVGKWEVGIGLGNISKYLGVYPTEYEAALIYVAYTIHHDTWHNFAPIEYTEEVLSLALEIVKSGNFRSRGTSGFKGVSFIKPRGIWLGSLTINKEKYSTEPTATAEEAARLYDELCIQLGVPHKVNPEETYR